MEWPLIESDQSRFGQDAHPTHFSPKLGPAVDSDQAGCRISFIDEVLQALYACQKQSKYIDQRKYGNDDEEQTNAAASGRGARVQPLLHGASGLLRGRYLDTDFSL